MTGMLNAVPRTPLHDRLRAAGRLIAESVGDQFVFTNIVPAGMSRLELYEGYRALLRRLYGYRSYRRRAMALILNQGTVLSSRVLARGDDLAVVLRIVWTCILRTCATTGVLDAVDVPGDGVPAPPGHPPCLHPGPHAQALLRVRAGDLEGPGRADPGAAAGGANALTDAAYLVRHSSGGLAMRALRGFGVLVLVLVLASAWGCGATARTEGPVSTTRCP